MQPSQVWIGIGALALCCFHSTWLPCSTFSQPFYLQLTLSAYQQPMPSFRLNGGCYGNFGRHKSPAARRSEESRKSTLFVSTRAHGERTAVVTRGRRRSGRVANAGQVSSARATCKAACAKKTYVGSFFSKKTKEAMNTKKLQMTNRWQAKGQNIHLTSRTKGIRVQG